MLEKLSVSNLAIVEKAEASFAPGLNVITGETGAGKSVLMGALDLVLGGRADSSVVRDGAKEAEIEASFEVERKGGDGREGRMTIRRTITSEGRSRAWVDDESVSIAELKELGRALVDIHGPRANQKLLEESFQRETLDAYGKVDKSAYSEAWSALVALRREIAELDGAEATEDEIDLLRFQVGEIEEAEITSDDDDLAERHAAASHAEDIVEAANGITEALGGDGGVADILVRLQPEFASVEKHLSEAAQWRTEAEELTVRAQELSRSVADAVSRIDADPEAFAEMDRRLGVVNRLKRKYLKEGGVPSKLLEILEAKKAKLDALEHRGERLAELRASEAEALARVKSAGAALTKRRQAAGAKLAKAVTKELRDLGFLQAAFSVALEACEPDEHGTDRTVYLFEPNPGEAARPLAAIASSGEIARVMLAMKSVLAEHDSVGLMVFDEIDANIGGEVGRVVGEKMRAVAANHQVIAITHLPQSAVYGARHLVVAKSVSGGRTRTRIEPVEGGARVAEIARMLGGEKLTSVVKRHAEELLELATKQRGN